MEKKQKSKYSLLLCALLIVQSIVFIFWGNIKEGYFIDELYSMEGAYNITRLSLMDTGYKWQTQENFFENWHQSEEFIEHITVGENDKLTNQPIQMIVNRLMKRPYYAMLNLVSGLNAGNYSKWYGIGLNIFIFIIVQSVLFSLSVKVTKSLKDALLVAGFYGFSAGAISTTIFIRTYMLSTLMVLLITYLHLFLWNSRSIWKKWCTLAVILAVTYYGYKVHEYVLIYSASVFMVYVVACILKRNWKSLCQYAGCFLVAGGGYFIANKKNLLSMLSGGQSAVAVENLFQKPLVDFIKDIMSYVATTIGLLFGNKYWVLLLIIGLVFFVCISELVLKKKVLSEIKDRLAASLHECQVAYALLAVTVIYIVVIARICPWISWRYICSTYPVMVLALFAIASNLTKGLPEKKTLIAFLAFSAVCILLSYNTNSIRELHLGAKEEARVLREEYSDVDSIFVYDGDEGRLYLNSYIYASGTDVFYTERNQFTDQEIFGDRSLPDCLLMWVSSENEDFSGTVDYFLEHSIYENSTLLLDRSRHNECYYVYLLQK